MKLFVCALAVLFSTTQLPPKPGTVKSLTEPKVDFTKFATYTWERGQESFDPAAHKAIIAAVDAEMAARGFRKPATGAGDVTVRYFTVTRTDVDLDTVEEYTRQNKPAPGQPLGRLVIVMRDSGNKRVWAADTVQPLPADRAKAYQEIAPIVVKLFETYPGPEKITAAALSGTAGPPC